MITIKIRDKDWFIKNCDLHMEGLRKWVVPSCWTREQQERTVHFLLDDSMWSKVGKVLKVDRVNKYVTGIMDSRYMADGYWIPNWAIEWVKEVEEEEVA